MNDIIFLKKLVQYDKKVGEFTIKKFLNHLWYLSEECVVFSLFDDRIDNDTKLRMANKILEGKEMDNEEEDISISNKKLCIQFKDLPHFLEKDLPCDLITNNSWRVFERFNISINFLRTEPSTWQNNTEYKEAKQVIGSLKIVNDTAERGVKLIEEYNDKFTKNEEQKQFLLKVVHDYHQKYPGFSRNVLKKPFL